MKENAHLKKSLSRREFLKVAGMGVASLAAASCRSNLEPVITATPGNALHTVAIAKVTEYNPKKLYQSLGTLLENLGGLADIIRPGDAVALKVNLTGGNYFEAYPGVDPVDSYVTHPEIAHAFGKHILEAGAGKISIVEALFSPDSYTRWGYEPIAANLGADLVDLNEPAPYNDFVVLPVGENWHIYESFKLNRLLAEVDVFISISKMKCHFSVGVTHTMKNLVGITPVQHYRTDPEHFWRSALHGDDYGPSRLPRVIVDLNRVRPIHFGLIDGIKAAEGGEVPRGTFKPVEPGILVAGKNALATDAVATAVMGFDPTTEYPNAPFLNGENYFNLAHAQGLGSHHLREIQVVGESVEDVRFEFAPSSEQANQGYQSRA